MSVIEDNVVIEPLCSHFSCLHLNVHKDNEHYFLLGP